MWTTEGCKKLGSRPVSSPSLPCVCPSGKAQTLCVSLVSTVIAAEDGPEYLIQVWVATPGCRAEPGLVELCGPRGYGA